jgi:hypothetical protein
MTKEERESKLLLRERKKNIDGEERANEHEHENEKEKNMIYMM